MNSHTTVKSNQCLPLHKRKDKVVTLRMRTRKSQTSRVG